MIKEIGLCTCSWQPLLLTDSMDGWCSVFSKTHAYTIVPRMRLIERIVTYESTNVTTARFTLALLPPWGRIIHGATYFDDACQPPRHGFTHGTAC